MASGVTQVKEEEKKAPPALKKNELLTLGKQYLEGESEAKEKLKNDLNGSALLSALDSAISAYPLNPEYTLLLETKPSDRKWLIEKKFPSLKKDSMAYVSVSDYLFNTELCKSFAESKQCAEQIAILKLVVENQPISETSVDLSTPKTLGIFAHQKKLSKDAYLELILGKIGAYTDTLSWN